MLTLLLSPVALAGEIQIEGSPAVFAVDGRVMESTAAGLRSPPLSDGVHRLDARNRSGETIAAIDLQVGADARVVVGYFEGSFSVLREEPLVLGGMTDGAPGSVSVVGLDRGAFVVRLAGEPLPYSYPTRSFVALALSPGDAGFVVWLEGEEVLTGAASVSSGQHTTCTVTYDAEIFSADCGRSGPALTADDVDLLQPISEMKLLALIERLAAAGRGARQLEILTEAVVEAHITASQLARLLQTFLLSADRLEAVRVAMPVLLDPGNAHLLESAFTFGGDRRRLRKMFE
ncbi:MAG: DUF4476 domain-containing protein [Myxococcota bacterium]|nr:DUF4476 domain-containing protein [Myxococcota bacterium]